MSSTDSLNERTDNNNTNDAKKRLWKTGQDEFCLKKPRLQGDEDDKCKRRPPNEPGTSSFLIGTHQHQSPKKRLEVPESSSDKHSKKEKKFIYGNYSKYYSYRNQGKDFHDIRLDVFEKHPTLFQDKVILDIGCNSGFLTIELARRFPIRHITGIDIDHSLINKAIKNLEFMKHKKTAMKGASTDGFPFNIAFLHANYVLRDDVLLEIEREQFDVILCLSVTKWIHLNFGDAGLKQSFKRMFLQLRTGGQLILEPQPFDNYGRRKKMTETIFTNYKAMNFFPKDFTDYLLSPEIGFKSVTLMGVPEHFAAGFKRPIQIFNKG